MRHAVFQTIAVGVVVAFFGYAMPLSAQPLLATGSEAAVSNEGLHRIDPRAMANAWARLDLDLGRYSEIFYMPATVAFRDVRGRYNARNTNTEAFPISDDSKAYFQETFGEKFYEQVRQVEPFEVSTQVGRDVLMVQGFLLDVVSGVPPDIVGRSGTLVRRPWEATLVLEIRDSMSDTLLARTADRHRVDGAFYYAELPRATQMTMQDWSRVLRSRLEDMLELGGGGWSRCELRQSNCE